MATDGEGHIHLKERGRSTCSAVASAIVGIWPKREATRLIPCVATELAR